MGGEGGGGSGGERPSEAVRPRPARPEVSLVAKVGGKSLKSEEKIQYSRKEYSVGLYDHSSRRKRYSTGKKNRALDFMIIQVGGKEYSVGLYDQVRKSSALYANKYSTQKKKLTGPSPKG